MITKGTKGFEGEMEERAQQPAAWLVEHRQLLPASGTALDVACGRGRHAIWLAREGFSVLAVDRDAEAIAELNARARRLGLDVRGEVRDMEGGSPGLGTASYDVVVGVHYLHRPLFPHLIAALRPGGVLVYETFTRDQAQLGRPSNPAYLLEPGELIGLAAPLEVVAAREGKDGNRYVASIVARKLLDR